MGRDDGKRDYASKEWLIPVSLSGMGHLTTNVWLLHIREGMPSQNQEGTLGVGRWSFFFF